eukprot:1452514-Pyramimonas_sp.AAC.1
MRPIGQCDQLVALTACDQLDPVWRLTRDRFGRLSRGAEQAQAFAGAVQTAPAVRSGTSGGPTANHR